MLFISPKSQQATVLHESKTQIEGDRLVNLAINSRDTRFARTGSVRLLQGLKFK